MTLSFQSHYGLILSVKYMKIGDNYVNTFNPTMVWFYLM